MSGDVDPVTTQWREGFDRRFTEQSDRTSDALDKITTLLEKQNHRVRVNELAIASMKTWIALVGGVSGVIGVGVALLQALK